MSIEDDPTYKAYMQELDTLHAGIQVYKKGINDEIEELKIVELIREQLAEAINYAGGDAQIVSLNEFSKLKHDMEEMDKQVNQHKAAIQNIEVIVRDRSACVDDLANKIANMKKKFESANVLSFKKDKA